MIWFKCGTHGPLSREAWVALRAINRAAVAAKRDVYVTSMRDGTHSAGSIHPQGDAFDIRPIAIDWGAIRKQVGADYDIVSESDHMHIEYDPK